jgi:TRAP-type C4-dicarboxylate transport system permease small subunit
MKFLHTIDDFIAKIETVSLIVFLSVMLSLGFLQVILRNVFSSGFSWADMLLRHLVLWVGLIGASLATKSERHINMDALSRILSLKAKVIMGIILNLIASFFSVAFIYAGYLFLMDEFAANGNKALFLGIPGWVAQLVIPLAFGVIAFRFLLHSIDKIVMLVTKQEIQLTEYKEI